MTEGSDGGVLPIEVGVHTGITGEWATDPAV